MATGPLTRPAAAPENAAAGTAVVALPDFGWPTQPDEGEVPGLSTPLQVPAAGFVLREEPPRRYGWPNFDPDGPDSTAPDTFDCGIAPEGLLRPQRGRNLRKETETAPADTGRHRSAGLEDAPESDAITAPATARDFREELTAIVKAVVREAAGALAADTFVAYYRVAGGPSRSIRRLAGAARDHGCRTVPSRERARLAVVAGREVLARVAGRVRFRHWDAASAQAKAQVPQPLPAFLAPFGYDPDSPRPEEIGETLRRMAGLFGLAFPFRFRATAKEMWVTPDDPEEADTVVETVHRLDALPPAPWHEWAEVTRSLAEPETARLRRVLETSARWSFLDPPGRFFWRRPTTLPPKHAENIGNPVLAALCRMFTVGVEARREMLLPALARTRGLRGRPIPEPVLLGIASRSGLFEVTPVSLRRRSGAAWFPPAPRDRALARLSAALGRTLLRTDLEAALVAAGATPNSARVEITRSPLLLPVEAPRHRRHRTYRFLFAPRHLFVPEAEAGKSD